MAAIMPASRDENSSTFGDDHRMQHSYTLEDATSDTGIRGPVEGESSIQRAMRSRRELLVVLGGYEGTGVVTPDLFHNEIKKDVLVKFNGLGLARGQGEVVTL